MKLNEAVHRILRKLSAVAPADGSYGFSNHIEGALVRNEDSTTFSSIGVIVDYELKQAEQHKLWECLFHVTKNLRLFYSNSTKYALIRWQDGAFTNVIGRVRLVLRNRLVSWMNEYAYKEGKSGTVEDLNEELRRLKGLQHIFVLTTKEKMDAISTNYRVNKKMVTFISMSGEDEYEATLRI